LASTPSLAINCNMNVAKPGFCANACNVSVAAPYLKFNTCTQTHEHTAVETKIAHNSGQTLFYIVYSGVYVGLIGHMKRVSEIMKRAHTLTNLRAVGRKSRLQAFLHHLRRVLIELKQHDKQLRQMEFLKMRLASLSFTRKTTNILPSSIE
jgi:hypothetical protein